jgi:hypothetical protein
MRDLDWANERYVRLHRTDTASFNLLGWEGRLLWFELLRKMDRVGTIPVEADVEPWESIAALLPHIPAEIVEKGMGKIIGRGWLEHNADAAMLYDAECSAREDTRMSDKARQAESRKRRKALAANEKVTPSHTTSHDVTECDKGVTKRDKKSHGVTPSHTTSHDVTPDRASPCLAVPNHAEKNPPSPPGGTAPKARKAPPKKRATAPRTLGEDLPEIPQSLDTPEFRQALEDRIAERADRKKDLWITPTRLKTLYRKFERVRQVNGIEYVVFCLERAVEGGYQGTIFEEDLEPKNNGRSRAGAGPPRMPRREYALNPDGSIDASKV